MNQVAERYAQALLSLAREEGTVERLKAEASVLREACGADLIRLLDSRQVTKAEKKALLAEATAGADANLRNLLFLLVDEGRCHWLRQILDAFVTGCNQELGIQEVLVVSARPLSPAEEKTIRDAVARRLDKGVEVTNRVDESLVAGTRIFVGGRVYDSSWKSRVRTLKEELLREGR